MDDVARAMGRAGHDALYIYRFDWDEEGVVNDKTFTDRQLQRRLYKALFAGTPAWRDEEYRALGGP